MGVTSNCERGRNVLLDLPASPNMSQYYPYDTTLIYALSSPRPLFIAQDELLHFTGRGFRQVAERDAGGTFEVRNTLAAEGDDLSLSCTLPRFQGDKGFGALAPLLIRDSYHGALHDGGVPRNCLLYLNGRDIFSARDDDILGAVTQFNVIIGVPHAHIT